MAFRAESGRVRGADLRHFPLFEVVRLTFSSSPPLIAAPINRGAAHRSPPSGWYPIYPRRRSNISCHAPSLPHPASSIQYPVSCIPRPASRIPHPVSSILHPVSRIPHPASSIQYLASSIPHPASRILPSTFRLTDPLPFVKMRYSFVLFSLAGPCCMDKNFLPLSDQGNQSQQIPSPLGERATVVDPELVEGSEAQSGEGGLH